MTENTETGSAAVDKASTKSSSSATGRTQGHARDDKPKARRSQGVWITHDAVNGVITPHSSEIAALRAAVEHAGRTATFVEFGENLDISKAGA